MASNPVMPRPRFPVWLLAALLALVTIALYWPATHCGFVNLDDNANVTDNVHIQKGLTWGSIRWVFFNPMAALWQPLTMLSHMAIYQVCGLNPWGHHLANVLLHALNTGLVFVLLQKMTKATWRSLLVAVLFAGHPLRVEAVAWVTERRDVLSAFFGLLALLAYVRYAQRSVISNQWSVIDGESCGAPASDHRSLITDHRLLFYLLSLGCFACGLMSKPMLVTWPFVMLLLDYWPLKRMENAEGRRQKAEGKDTHHASRAMQDAPRSTFHALRFTPLRLIAEKIPFFALAATASVVTFVVQRRGGALAVGEGLPLSVRLGNALISYSRYLGKLIWPVNLAVYYPHPGYWPLGKVLLAGGVILAISVLTWVGRRRHPCLLVGWLWYCGTLVPMSQVIQTGAHAMADRWTYIPSIGVLVLTVWGACELTRRWQYRSLGLSVAGSATIILCIALTQQEIGYWRDSEVLLRHALAVTENNCLAHNNLGVALKEKGQIDEAIRQFQEALRIRPDYVDAHNNLGVALDRKGQAEEASRQFQEALRLKPGDALAHRNLGAALSKQGQLDEAIRQYQEAIRLEPGYAQVHCYLGVALSQKGQFGEAIRQYQEAIRLKPDLADAHNNLGAAFDQQGQTDKAIPEFREAIRLEPAHTDAHNNLGIVLQKQGQTDEAIRQLQQALRLKPDHVEAHYNLGIALGSKGQVDEAIHQFQETLRLRPDHADAHNALGLAFYLQDRIGEAIPHFQEAVRLKPDYASARDYLQKALSIKSQTDAGVRP